jgi:hypothetical protein
MMHWWVRPGRKAEQRGLVLSKGRAGHMEDAG